MAMIQVVVTLYEGDYQNICKLGYVGQEMSEDVGRAIKDGTILPKGHGKLLDADRTLKNTEEIYNASNIKDIINPAQMYAVRKILTNAQTIIEADKNEVPTVVEADEQELKEAASKGMQKEQIENDSRSNRMKFILNGCDISFIAEAPEDMTVKQLVEQADRIKPDWCACGVCKDTGYEEYPTEIVFDYNSVRKTRDDVCCDIR